LIEDGDTNRGRRHRLGTRELLVRRGTDQAPDERLDRGRIDLDDDWSPSIPFGLTIGMVAIEMLPPAILENSETKLRMSSFGSVISERFTELSSFCSLNGFSSVLPDVALWNTADRKYCWRAMRSISPRGRPCRCRTNASAASP